MITITVIIIKLLQFLKSTKLAEISDSKRDREEHTCNKRYKGNSL